MAKKTNIDVRIHAQEQEWLINLGKGNIVDGARNMVEQLTGKPSSWDEYAKTKERTVDRKYTKKL